MVARVARCDRKGKLMPAEKMQKSQGRKQTSEHREKIREAALKNKSGNYFSKIYSQENRSCPYCKKVFTVRSSSPQKHCSVLCARRNQKTGKDSPYWKGGLHRRKGNNYVSIYISPGQEMLEHRFLMEQHLGRKLNEGEIVHHINGIKNDNRIENLKVLEWGEHTSLHKNENTI